MAEYKKHIERSSIWGHIHWSRSLGAPRNAPVEDGFDVTCWEQQAFGQGAAQDWPSIRDLITYDISTEDEFVVAFWGPHIISPYPVLHTVLVTFRGGVDWDMPSNRQIDPEFRPIELPQSPTIIRLEPFQVVVPRIVIRDRYEHDFYRKMMELATK